LFIEFTDSGPGVQDASRVFDPFYTTKPVGKGTGLGLSICYGIVTEHGGTIRVRNMPARGACFTIELPVQSWVPPPAFAKTETPARAKTAAILLVDRDSSVLEAVGTILGGRGHRVHAASGVPEARALFATHEFDVVVADLQFATGPNADGILEWMAENKPALCRKLIWMCAVAPLAVADDRILRSGSCILQKPFKSSDLLAAVDDLLLDRVDATAVEG